MSFKVRKAMKTDYKDFVITTFDVFDRTSQKKGDGIGVQYYIPKNNGLKSDMYELIYYGRITKKALIEQAKKIIDLLYYSAV